MHLRRSFLAIAAFASLLLISCGKDPGPTGPQVTSANGFLAERGNRGATAINLQDSSAGIYWDLGSKGWIMTATGSTEFAKRSAGDHAVSLWLLIPRQEPGTHTWSESDLNMPSPFSWLRASINGTEYLGMNGSITITAAGKVGEKVTGSFSGTLRSLSGDSITVRNGRFSATREADRMPPVQADPNSLVITGNGFSRFTVNLGDGGGAIGWVYPSERYISLVVSTSSTMVAPGEEGVATLSIEYPDLLTGTLVWGLKSHSKVTVRLGDRTYVGKNGVTTLKRLGSGLFGEISGTLTGTLVDIETQETLKLETGQFLGRRGN